MWFRKKDPAPPYLTQTRVFGDGDSSVYFVDEARWIRRKLVDRNGRICRFPGIVKEDFWLRKVTPDALRPRIQYRTSFEDQPDGGWRMLWQIQPDGRCWGDEGGFGMENDVEVTLYADIDKNGRFTGPFRVYRLGATPFL